MTKQISHRVFNRILLTTLAGFLCLSAISPIGLARAQDAMHCIDELSDEEVQYRISKIDESFKKGEVSQKMWRFGWMSVLTANSALSIYSALDAERKYERVTWGVLSAASLATVVQLLVTPMPEIAGYKRFKKKPDSTPEERVAKLRYGTKIFKKAANIQEFLTGPGEHLNGINLSLISGTVHMRRYFRKLQTARARNHALLLFFLPMTVNEAKILSQPTHQYKDWENYRQIACSSRYYDTGGDELDLDLSFGPGGGTFKLSF